MRHVPGVAGCEALAVRREADAHDAVAALVSGERANLFAGFEVAQAYRVISADPAARREPGLGTVSDAAPAAKDFGLLAGVQIPHAHDPTAAARKRLPPRTERDAPEVVVAGHIEKLLAGVHVPQADGPVLAT